MGRCWNAFKENATQRYVATWSRLGNPSRPQPSAQTEHPLSPQLNHMVGLSQKLKSQPGSGCRQPRGCLSTAPVKFGFLGSGKVALSIARSRTVDRGTTDEKKTSKSNSSPQQKQQKHEQQLSRKACTLGVEMAFISPASSHTEGTSASKCRPVGARTSVYDTRITYVTTN
ncbi:hypothetical protein Taro_000942 [Colocasia esculenta]|uniref:Uncharacterized protein n=1 Tax=Colocasia esculenta TaxID=4460 RepID=A0A843TDH8_COLES|nr:hypothetical protein [Colocasia esculenta]